MQNDAKCCRKHVEVSKPIKLELEPINVSKFRRQCLLAHNICRQVHCCPPVSFCQELNSNAMDWAKNLARMGRMGSCHFENYGENLYCAENIDLCGALPVKRWYEEIENYRFGSPKFQANTSHFTQLIWKNSRKIGVGVARKDSTTYVVVYYYPPGNIESQFAKMVPRRVL